MTQGLTDPNSVKSSVMTGEKIGHLFGIQFDEADLACTQCGETIRILQRVVVLACSGVRCRLCCGEPVGYLDLFSRDRDAGHGAAECAGKVAGGPPNATANVQNSAILLYLGNVEKQLDEV